MFWYVILMLLSPLYLMFDPVFRTEQARLSLLGARDARLQWAHNSRFDAADACVVCAHGTASDTRHRRRTAARK